MARQARTASANLPHQLTSFVGRAADLRAVRDSLTSTRMLTLVGTGGAGKSRLAVEIARANEGRWPDGIWWVELASAGDVAGAVVATLELPGRGSPADVIAAWLGPKQALLILDNCEHLVEGCAELAQRLLERSPKLTVLATSRESLGVPGEVRWPVAALNEADAIRLFEERGRLAAPGFKVGDSNLKTVGEICTRLDRLPLAIEMAAARLDVMSEGELLENLDDRLNILRSGDRTSAKRQTTMAAAIDWSYRLLAEHESRLFRRLAVFRGGFTREAVESVCADPGDRGTLDLLSNLVRKSMAVAEKLDDGSTRYRLLESHLAFALERLEESGELEEMRRRHHDYFLIWQGAGGRTSEAGNLWSALEWARTGRKDQGLEMAIRIAEFEFSDQARIRRVLLDLMETQSEPTAARAMALNLAARLVARQGELKTSKSLADSSVKLGRKLGSRELLAYVVRGAGLVYHTRGELETASQMYSEAFELLQDSGDRALAIEVKNSLGVLAVERGALNDAMQMLEECVAYARGTAQHASLARYLESLADVHLALGNVDAAASSWREALTTFRDLNDAFGCIWCTGGLALVSAKRGDFDRALRLASAADRMSREWSLTTGPFRRKGLAGAVAESRGRLPAQRADSAWAAGQDMTMKRAVDYALGAAEMPTGAQAEAAAGPLTRREREVAAMVADGMTNREIAERLFISERTAEGHVERIRGKLGVRSRTDVATWAVTRGLGRTKLDKSTPASTV